ncbi:hypothetical protein [Burkholderia sp. L27(2015)]|uniref:hypothetical protein n=1 Tax=Burkholderia sp. L27(2015) TaxID=1641858 RepID=UPI00131E380F|nr:hypothetical protein [Burkholderia sp. L27(2015)]
MLKLITVLILSALLCACVASGEYSSSTPEHIAATHAQIQQNSQSSAAVSPTTGASTSQPIQIGVILIGNVGPMHELDEYDRQQMYARYAKYATSWHPGKPIQLTEDNFVKQIAGWTTVTFISGGTNYRKVVLVPVGVADKVNFASPGDLVVARSNEDGNVLLEKVLCSEQDAAYHQCASQFASAWFDIVSGRELDRDFKPSSHGALIDLATYKTGHAEK